MYKEDLFFRHPANPSKSRLKVKGGRLAQARSIIKGSGVSVTLVMEGTLVKNYAVDKIKEFLKVHDTLTTTPFIHPSTCWKYSAMIPSRNHAPPGDEANYS